MGGTSVAADKINSTDDVSNDYIYTMFDIVKTYGICRETYNILGFQEKNQLEGGEEFVGEYLEDALSKWFKTGSAAVIRAHCDDSKKTISKSDG